MILNYANKVAASLGNRTKNLVKPFMVRECCSFIGLQATTKGHKRLSNRFMTIAFIYEKIWFTNLTARARLRRNKNIKKIFRKNFYGVKIVNPQRVGRKLYHRKAFVDCRKISFAPVILLCSSLSDTLCVVSDYKASLLCASRLYCELMICITAGNQRLCVGVRNWQATICVSDWNLLEKVSRFPSSTAASFHPPEKANNFSNNWNSSTGPII